MSAHMSPGLQAATIRAAEIGERETRYRHLLGKMRHEELSDLIEEVEAHATRSLPDGLPTEGAAVTDLECAIDYVRRAVRVLRTGRE